MIDPAIVVALRLGMEVSAAGALLGRCFGIALVVCVRQHVVQPSHGANGVYYREVPTP